MSNSYRQIFKSTALIGGTQAVRILMGIARTKVLALLLGPSGIGIVGMYQSTAGVIGTLAGFGIGQAGVRQIAEAVGTSDQLKIARTVSTLRFTSLLSGLLGFAAILLLCRQIGFSTFGSYSYTSGIALMSLVLLFDAISAGQLALLQGTRRLKDLASCQVFGVTFGAAASIILVYFLRERGIAWYLVAISGFGILSSWWYARKVRIISAKINVREIAKESRSLLGMGLAFMVTSLLVSGTDYMTRVLIVRQLGNDAVGLYSATWTLSSLYVGVILGAMGADFYPRLTGVSTDDTTVNRLVNEQTEMGILIATPGILCTLTLAPWVLTIFYSHDFILATDVIRWQSLGVALRVVSFPLSFILLAKGMSKLYMLTETVFAAINISLLIIGIRLWSLEGAGISFFALYILYTITMLCVCNRVTGFRWSKKSVSLTLSTTGVSTALLMTIRNLSVETGAALGLLVTAAVSIACVFQLHRMLKFDIRRFITFTFAWHK